eukprot:jgi/Tetstr1/430349/TSEL_001974.t1
MFWAHIAALFVDLDELLPYYVPATNQDFAPYLARPRRNHAEAIDKAFRFRLAFLRRLNEIKRVHSDHGELDVLRVQHFQPAAEHLGICRFRHLDVRLRASGFRGDNRRPREGYRHGSVGGDDASMSRAWT